MYGEAVQIFEFFLTKLNPKCERLFQYLLSTFSLSSFKSNGNSDVWFACWPIVKNTFANMMQHLSRKKCCLSQVYTCHSVRALCITLFRAGVAPGKMISITLTKHKNTSSLKHLYFRFVFRTKLTLFVHTVSFSIRSAAATKQPEPEKQIVHFNKENLNPTAETVTIDLTIPTPPTKNRWVFLSSDQPNNSNLVKYLGIACFERDISPSPWITSSYGFMIFH